MTPLPDASTAQPTLHDKHATVRYHAGLLYTPLYTIREVAEDIVAKIHNNNDIFLDRQPTKNLWGTGVRLVTIHQTDIVLSSYRSYMDHWFWLIWGHFEAAYHYYDKEAAKVEWLKRINEFVQYNAAHPYAPNIPRNALIDDVAEAGIII